MIGASTVVVSIMAGRTLQFIAGALKRPCALVRAMPNTPAAIGRGITVAVPRDVNHAQRDLAHRPALRNRQRRMDRRRGADGRGHGGLGSGPAYVFLLAEALAEAGVAAGLPPPLAAKLARETVAGSGELLHRSELEPRCCGRT